MSDGKTVQDCGQTSQTKHPFKLTEKMILSPTIPLHNQHLKNFVIMEYKIVKQIYLSGLL